MSLIDDVLVYADSQPKFVLNDLVKIIGKNKKQVIASSLGRLASKELIEKKANREFKISVIGKQKINSILKNLKIYSEIQGKNNNWQIVIFNISEKQRSLRDILRNNLINLGFGKIQDSVWVSYHNFTTEIKELVKILSIQDRIILISTNNIDDNNNDILHKIQWDWDLLNSQYRQFIKEAEKFLNKKNKEHIYARILVYNLAKIMQKDPKLPVLLQPKNALTNKAFVVYQKIRPHCY